MDMISIKKLSFTYPTGTQALSGISLDIAEGSFVTLCGASGCGKSTLLRLVKQGLEPRGCSEGEVRYCGTLVAELAPKVSAEEIGFVMQSPENQLVTDKVWHELAFSLESTGVPQGDMRRRVGEMASYFGLDDRFFSDTAALSGGQKQLLALASAAAVHPRLLLLDEPASQLDPISARSLIEAVQRLNRDFGVTVVIAEHRLEGLLECSDRVVVLERGRIIADCPPRDICGALPREHAMMYAMPVSVRMYAMGGGTGEAPLSVREGRRSEVCRSVMRGLTSPKAAAVKSGEPLIFAKELWVSYGKGTSDVLSSASVEVRSGEVLAILGGNGSGKTTLLKCLAGTMKPLGGKLRRKKDVTSAYLPQEVCALFRHETVREELGGEPSELLPEELYSAHPYDLSGGEQQRLAIAVTLRKNPDVLLLDEPTKGMDCFAKSALASLLRQLAAEGRSVVLVTHDTELAAECADRCALLFGGEIVSEAPPAEFFSENYFYTTPARRITRGISDKVIYLLPRKFGVMPKIYSDH